MTTWSAHIVSLPSYERASGALWLAVIIIATAVLATRHLFVKHPRHIALRRLRFYVAITALFALVATFAPMPASASQPTPPVGLPDLVSYPPIIWFDKLITDENDDVRKVLAFDGYLLNQGEGMLDFLGNPQEPLGMKQRIFDGAEWVEVGEVSVVYETSDDHNHFHLMAAAEYELWDEGQTTPVGESAKVGFCLLDTENLEQRMDIFYEINEFQYCAQDDPDATEMRMGISPGWVDTYDANTTLQWVDITSVSPGRYWVGASIDPLNQVVESNEENNGTVFSSNKWSISGYTARELQVQSADAPITLKADAFGEVRDPVFSIVEGPSNGTLSVPLGVDLVEPTITYVPDAGFDGIDEFAYTVRDSDNYFPLLPEPAVVQVDASAAAGAVSGEADATGDFVIEAPFGTLLETAMHRQLETAPLTATITADESAEVEWFAAGLPGGLFVDQTNGTIHGIATAEGSGSAVITAALGERSTSLAIDWVVAASDLPALSDIAPISTPADVDVSLFVGAGTSGAEYTAVGLPPGVRMVSNIPQIAGSPTESGVYEVVVTESLDGATTTTSFTWTVRPKTTPTFPL